MESIEEIVTVLKAKYNIPLAVDGYGGFQINFDRTLPIQVETEPSGKEVLVFSEIGFLPGGPFRTNALEAALKANGMAKQKSGIFAFSPQGDFLVFFRYLQLRLFTPETFFDTFELFLGTASLWHEDIKNGRVPEIDTRGFDAKSGSGFMGMK